MPNANLKQAAHELIDKLPDNAIWDDAPPVASQSSKRLSGALNRSVLPLTLAAKLLKIAARICAKFAIRRRKIRA